MGFIAEETHNEVIKLYEEQITSLKNELALLMAKVEAEEKTEQDNAEAGVDQAIATARIFRNAKITGQ